LNFLKPCGVYQIRNPINGKRYIGSSISLKSRYKNHFSQLKLNKHGNIHLQRSYNKYGPGAFGFDVLLYCDPKNCLYYEQKLLDAVSPEYNLRSSANNSAGTKWSAEVRAKHDAINQTLERKEQRRRLSLGNKYGIGNRSRLGQRQSSEEKIRHSIASRGESNGNAKLSDQKVLFIRWLNSRGCSCKKLAELANVAPTTISMCVNKKTWRYI